MRSAPVRVLFLIGSSLFLIQCDSTPEDGSASKTSVNGSGGSGSCSSRVKASNIDCGNGTAIVCDLGTDGTGIVKVLSTQDALSILNSKKQQGPYRDFSFACDVGLSTGDACSHEQKLQNSGNSNARGDMNASSNSSGDDDSNSDDDSSSADTSSDADSESDGDSDSDSDSDSDGDGDNGNEQQNSNCDDDEDDDNDDGNNGNGNNQ